MKRITARCLLMLGLLALCPSCSFLQDEFFVFDVPPPVAPPASSLDPAR